MSTDKKSILVTGGTGFAGSHLAELLHATEPESELHVTHVTPVSPALLQLLPDVQLHQVDLTNLADVQSLLTQVQPTHIYQLASIPVVGDSFARATEIFQANTAVVHNLLETARTMLPMVKILVVTSAEVYGTSLSSDELPIRESHAFRPVNPYGISKVTQDLLAECYSRAFGMQIIRVRPFNHIGERQQAGFAVADFSRQLVAIERGQATTLQVGDLSTKRDFTDVKDIVRGYQLLMEKGTVGAVYNLGSGTAISMQEIVDQLIAMIQESVVVERIAARNRPSDVPVMQADISKARELGWNPEIPLSATLQRILGYWRGL